MMERWRTIFQVTKTIRSVKRELEFFFVFLESTSLLWLEHEGLTFTSILGGRLFLHKS